jgi:hypothetical protein
VTIHHIKNAKIFFDNKLLGKAVVDLDAATGPASDDFLDISKADVDFAAARTKEMSGEFKLHMDIESEQRLKQFLMYPYQLEAMKRISNLAGRFQPFEFGPPMFYHGDMMRNEDNRRFTVVKSSATGKSQTQGYSLRTYGARLMRPANVGKTDAMMIRHLINTRRASLAPSTANCGATACRVHVAPASVPSSTTSATTGETSDGQRPRREDQSGRRQAVHHQAAYLVPGRYPLRQQQDHAASGASAGHGVHQRTG